MVMLTLLELELLALPLEADPPLIFTLVVTLPVCELWFVELLMVVTVAVFVPL